MEPIVHDCRTSQAPSPRPARATCGRLVLLRTQSDGWVVQAARARSIPTLTAAARPTGPVAAACTAWDAAAAGDARASEPARWDGPYQPPADHCCRHHSRCPAPPQETRPPLAPSPLLSSVTPPPLLTPLPPLLASHPPLTALAAASRTACSLSCSTWAIAACMARPAS